MLSIPPHLEACRPRGLFSIFHGTSSPVARRCPRASDLVLSAEHAFLLYERPGLHLQSGASAVGGVLHGARRSSRCFSFGAICDFNPRAPCGARRQPQRHPVNHLHISIHAPRAGCDGKFDGFTRPNLRKRYKKVSVQPKKRAKKKIKEMLCSHSQMLCSHSHIFGWISGAKVPEFPAR